MHERSLGIQTEIATLFEESLLNPDLGAFLENVGREGEIPSLEDEKRKFSFPQFLRSLVDTAAKTFEGIKTPLRSGKFF